MPLWSVPIEGGYYDLARLAARKWMDADVQVVGDSGKEGLLRSETFAHLKSAPDVRRAAIALLERLNQAAHLDEPRYKPCRMLPQVYDDSGPERKITSFGFAEARLGGTFTADAGGPPRATLAERAYALGPSHKALEDALKALAEDDWVGWYKVWEIARTELGSIPADAVSGAEIKLFKWTANHPDAAGATARHARLRDQAPSDPMPEYQGKAIAARLIECIVRDIESRE